jgi:hypothetical protein
VVGLAVDLWGNDVPFCDRDGEPAACHVAEDGVAAWLCGSCWRLYELKHLSLGLTLWGYTKDGGRGTEPTEGTEKAQDAG